MVLMGFSSAPKAYNVRYEKYFNYRHLHTQTMTHKDFHIGLEFWCSGKRWQCTDVGSRVVVAISLEAHEVVNSERDPNDPTKRIEQRYMSSDPILFDGPPYGIVEHVFDEDSLEACSFTPDE